MLRAHKDQRRSPVRFCPPFIAIPAQRLTAGASYHALLLADAAGFVRPRPLLQVKRITSV